MCWQAGKQTGRGGAALPSWAPGARHSAVSGSVSQHNHAASHAALSPKRPHAARRAARIGCKTAPGVARLPARNHCGNRHRGRSFTIDSTPLRAREQENRSGRWVSPCSPTPLLPVPVPGRMRASEAAPHLCALPGAISCRSSGFGTSLRFDRKSKHQRSLRRFFKLGHRRCREFVRACFAVRARPKNHGRA